LGPFAGPHPFRGTGPFPRIESDAGTVAAHRDMAW